MTITSVSNLLEFFREGEYRRFQEVSLRPGVGSPEHIGAYGLWFRGQPHFADLLVPTVFRGGQLIDEGALNWHFMLRAAHHRKDCHTSFDWLCLMRHYGMPSRLLDWTENPLVALFFACQSGAPEPASLFILNSRRLNQAVRGDIEGWAGICVPSSLAVVVRSELADSDTLQDYITKLRSLPPGSSYHGDRLSPIIDSLDGGDQAALDYVAKPVAVFPYRSDPRLIVQQSVFTIHGGKGDPRGGLPTGKCRLPKPVHLENLDTSADDHDKVLIRLKVENKQMILEELQQIGVSSATLFPDLDHESDWLKKLWVSSSP
jgi:hypothetical protein